MIRSFSFLVLFLVLSFGAHGALPGNSAQHEVSGTNTGPAAAGNGADLAPGLAYVRANTLTPAELQPVAENKALILDLRYVTADEHSPETLRRALVNRPTGQQILILVSPATPAALAPVISATPAVTLGAPESVPAPKVIVHTDAATDRRAYDAFTSGTPLSELISGKIQKERYDEASLVKDFKAGLPEPERPAPKDPTALPGNPATPEVSGTFAPAEAGGRTQGGQQAATGHPGLAAASNGAAEQKPATKPAPLTDRVLQRAVNLHAARLALRSRS